MLPHDAISWRCSYGAVGRFDLSGPGWPCLMPIFDIIKIIALCVFIWAIWPVLKIGVYEVSAGSDRIAIAWRTAKAHNFQMDGLSEDFEEPAGFRNSSYIGLPDCAWIDGIKWCQQQ